MDSELLERLFVSPSYLIEVHSALVRLAATPIMNSHFDAEASESFSPLLLGDGGALLASWHQTTPFVFFVIGLEAFRFSQGDA